MSKLSIGSHVIVTQRTDYLDKGQCGVVIYNAIDSEWCVFETSTRYSGGSASILFRDHCTPEQQQAANRIGDAICWAPRAALQLLQPAATSYDHAALIALANQWIEHTDIVRKACGQSLLQVLQCPPATTTNDFSRLNVGDCVKAFTPWDGKLPDGYGTIIHITSDHYEIYFESLAAENEGHGGNSGLYHVGVWNYEKESANQYLQLISRAANIPVSASYKPGELRVLTTTWASRNDHAFKNCARELRSALGEHP